MLDMSDVVSDPDMGAQSFTVTRSAGIFGMGGFQTTATTLTAYGTMQPATEEHDHLFPEGERPSGSIVIRSTVQLYRTTPGPPPQQADIVTWNGEQYRVVGVKNWAAAGFWLCGAERIGGQA